MAGRQVVKILDKWIGPSDQSRSETFYLVHYVGEPEPTFDDNDSWKHPMELEHVKHMLEGMCFR